MQTATGVPNGIYVRAFADDVNIIGPAQILTRVFPELCRIFETHMGSSPNMRKTAMVGNDITADMADELRAHHITNISNQGGMCLGVPIGDAAYRTCSVRRVLAATQRSFTVTQNHEIDPQLKFAFLKYCLYPKAQYIARNVNPELARAPLATLDTWVLSLLQNIMGQDTSVELLAPLPMRWGGLGLYQYSGGYGIHCYRSARLLIASNLARLTGCAQVPQALPSIPLDPCSPDFLNLLHEPTTEERVQHRLALAKGTADLSLLPDVSQTKPLDAYHKQLFILALGSLSENEGEGADNIIAVKHKCAALLSGVTEQVNSYGHAGLDHWLNWMGGGDSRQRLEPEIFVTALRARMLGGPLYLAQPCSLPECHGTHLAQFPLHGTCCRNMPGAKGLTTARHNLIRDYLLRLIKNAYHQDVDPGIQVLSPEFIVGQVASSDGAPRNVIADIRWVSPVMPADGRRELWFDVHVVEPTGVRGARNPNHPVHRGAAAREGVMRKLAQYAQIPTTARVVPFVLESGGLLCNEVVDFLDNMVTGGHKDKVRCFVRDLSYIITRYRALMINNHASQNERIRLGGPQELRRME
jgi:hypothetical protein